MPRPARFDRATILAAALRVVAAQGPAGLTTDAVATEMGGHVGSIYYRFPSKDHLLAELWMQCARAGQVGLLAVLPGDDDVARLHDAHLGDIVEAAVLHYPRWARTDPAAARVLAAHGREQLVPHTPDELADELATINDDLARALDHLTRRLFDDVGPPQRQAVTFALLDLPGAAVRRFLLAGRPPPESLDGPILAAARAALHAGDQEMGRTRVSR